MHKKVFSSLYFQVLLAITLGVFLGHVYPDLGADMKPLGDGFVKLIKMIIAPVIFCTVVTGIAGMESMKAVGKTGAIALLYFEVVSTIALVIGLCVVNLLQPGKGLPPELGQALLAEQGERAAQIAADADTFAHSLVQNKIRNRRVRHIPGRLRGFDKRLAAKAKLPIHIAEDPLRAVVRGTGMALKNIAKFKSILIK